MSKSTPVPAANTFAEAFPNSTKVFDESFVDTPDGRVQLRVPVREVTLSGGEPPLRLYDTSGPQGHDARQGLPKLREPWVAPVERDARQASSVTQLHYARGARSRRRWSSSPRAKACRRISCATKWRAAARSFPPTSITPSSSR